MALLDTIGSVLGTSIKFLIIGAVIIIVLSGAIGYFVWRYKKKKWNIQVGVKLPRANGTLLHEEAKGYYDVVEGVVLIKREGVSAVPMKPFDVKSHLQGTYLEVIGLSPTDYIPVHPSSYEIIKVKVKDKNGIEHSEERVILNLESDLLKRKTWKNYAERSLKDAFTIKGFLDKHWKAIEMGIILFCMFIGFAVLKSTKG
jgi:hypothetical protein